MLGDPYSVAKTGLGFGFAEGEAEGSDGEPVESADFT